MKLTLFGYSIIIEKISEMDTCEKKEVSQAKKSAAKKATKVRSDNAKKKIENAMNILRFEGKNLSNYAISKESGCSINTVKKYIKKEIK